MPKLSQRIQEFYDSSSELWEKIWGEHMHHGYYYPGETKHKDRRIAQIDLIEELLTWANPEVPSQVLDVGCGIGGSSLFLAERYNCHVTGITLSPVQAQRATERAKSQNLTAQTDFRVADAMNMPFADNSFDLVWSLESGEHMPDKAKFLQECDRVLKPNGRLIFATWCHRNTDAKPLTNDEKKHLQRIYDVYCLPYVISLAEYTEIAQNLNFQALKIADWSKEVALFWDLVIDSALTPSGILSVLTAGLPTLNAAISLRLMSRGYERGLVKFGLLTGTKKDR